MAEELLSNEQAVDHAFTTQGVIPLTLLRDAPPAEALRLYGAWLGRQGVSLTAGAWLPVGSVGPVLILAHHDAGAPCALPAWAAQRACITEASYQKLWRATEAAWMSRRKWDGHVPAGPAPEKTPFANGMTPAACLKVIIDHMMVPEADRVRLVAALTKPNITPGDLGDGYAEGIQFLCGRSRVVDVRNAAFAGPVNRLIQESVRASFNISVLYATERTIYMVSPTSPNHQATDMVSAMLASGGRKREIRLIIAPPAHIRETLASRSNQENSAEANRIAQQATAAAAASNAVDRTKSDIVLDEGKLAGMKPIPGDTSSEEYFHWLLYRGIKAGASDLHFEQVNNSGRVRMRKNGEMMILDNHPYEVSRSLLGFVKSGGVPGLDTNNFETQDARGSVSLGAKRYNLRINLTPHRLDTHQVMVIRLQAKQSDLLNLDKLSLGRRQVSMIRRAIGRPTGLILVTGPTGSGKTTTLYACLSEVNKNDVKINTIEDPIEIDLEGATQSQLDEVHEVGFTRLQRATLRQDPDIILIGEIRDRESAQAALSMAETGHLVFSTLHTNSEVDTITRMMDLVGDKDRLVVLARALIMIVAQRLVKKLCPNCRQARPLTDREKHILENHHMALPENGEVFEPNEKGCPTCDHGYAGRTVIMSLLPITAGVSDLIMKSRDTNTILDEARKNANFRSLFEEALVRVVNGEINFGTADDWADPWEGFDFTDKGGAS